MDPEQHLDRLYRYILGGVNPAGAASSSGDLGQLVKYLVANPAAAAGFYPILGQQHPFVSAESDATIAANTTISGSVGKVKRYRDLTINSGIVLTCELSPQIIVCRDLAFGDTSSEIRAVSPHSGSVSGGRGGGPYTGATTYTSGDLRQLFPGMDSQFAAGGAGGAGASTPGAASAGSAFDGSVSLLLAALLAGWPIHGGGQGGAGSNNAGAGSNGAGGAQGCAGQSGLNSQGSGGGSGIGGGGGGGGYDTDIASGSGSGTAGFGGGVVVVIVTGTVSGAAGLVTADGTAGSDGTASKAAQGGGGGGLAAMLAKAASVTPTLRANGGAAGATGGTHGAAAAGGAGATYYLVG